MRADATPQLYTERHLGLPWTFDAVLMAGLFAHERLLAQVRTRVEAIRTEEPRPQGNPPT